MALLVRLVSQMRISVKGLLAVEHRAGHQAPTLARVGSHQAVGVALESRHPQHQALAAKVWPFLALVLRRHQLERLAPVPPAQQG